MRPALRALGPGGGVPVQESATSPTKCERGNRDITSRQAVPRPLVTVYTVRFLLFSRRWREVKDDSKLAARSRVSTFPPHAARLSLSCPEGLTGFQVLRAGDRVRSLLFRIMMANHQDGTPLSRCRLAVDREQLVVELLGRLSHPLPPLVANEAQVQHLGAETEMRRSPPFPTMYAIQKQVFCPLRFQWHSPGRRGTSHAPPFRRRPGSDWPARVQHLSGLFCRELSPEPHALGRGKTNRSAETTLSPRMAIWLRPSRTRARKPVEGQSRRGRSPALFSRVQPVGSILITARKILMLLDAGSPARFNNGLGSLVGVKKLGGCLAAANQRITSSTHSQGATDG